VSEVEGFESPYDYWAEARDAARYAKPVHQPGQWVGGEWHEYDPDPAEEADR